MFKENLKRIISAKKKTEKISQARIAREIGVSASNITEWLKGRATPNPEKLRELAKVLNVSVDSLISETELPAGVVILNEEYKLPVYSSIKGGDGEMGITDGSVDGYISVSKEYVKQKVFCLRVSGNSMKDKVCDGEIAIFKPINGDSINEQDIYAVEVEGWSSWVIKFVSHSPSGKVELISANSAFPVKEIDPDISRVIIRGKLIESRRLF